MNDTKPEVPPNSNSQLPQGKSNADLGDKSPTLAIPFNQFFASFEEAQWGFELIARALRKLGVNPEAFEKDRRICLSLAGDSKPGDRMRLNFGDWAILTFRNLSAGTKRIDFVCRKDRVPMESRFDGKPYAFAHKVDGHEFSSGLCSLASLHDVDSAESKAFEETLGLAAKRFLEWKGSSYSSSHQPQALQMVFDHSLRQELLKDGLEIMPAEKSGYWLFQAKPTQFNLIGALNAGALGTWQVNQHRKEIHLGDRVVLWLSGDDAGVYGLATVTSEVGEILESPAEAAFQIPPEQSTEPFVGVTLKVDSNLSDSPILKEEMLKYKHTKGAPIGRQGTNFPLTEKQFNAIASMTPAKNDGRRYWLYAPGEHARFWQECQNKSIMVIGYDELGEFQKYNSQDEIEKKLKQLWKVKQRPYNHSRAVWEFVKVLQPGDVVIAKKGRNEYLGYGIVDGPCERDESRSEYKNFRRVKWIKSGNWSADFKLVVKALTDVTKYPDYVVKLTKLIGITTDNLSAPTPQSPKILPALNIILYGPPGTGKTYRLRNHYMELFTDRQAVLGVEERASALVKDLAWWEVVALALLDSKGNSGTVPQILTHPFITARHKNSNNKKPQTVLWGVLQAHTKTDCPNVKYASRMDPLIFSKDESSVWSVDAKLTETEAPELRAILQSFRNPPKEEPVVNRWKFTTFHQSFSYEDFVEGIKPQMEDRDDGQLAYEVRPGIFKAICADAEANPGKPYALFIDEINRGNVASIFGELITLIEEDKRLYADNALTPELPYSRKTFGVPPNLYIIGTMNTADRSVEALDTALRRRFTFVEMRPDPSVIKYPASLNVDLPKLLTVINDRIEQLLDHDHCIGHAYFMGIKNLADIRSVFANKIIPLLREYFYGNPAKVGMVLGERFVSRKSAKTPFAVGSWGADELDEKEVFTFPDTSKLTAEDFQTIYVEPSPGV